jgi:hypothetical protein
VAEVEVEVGVAVEMEGVSEGMFVDAGAAVAAGISAGAGMSAGGGAAADARGVMGDENNPMAEGRVASTKA